MLMGRDIPPRKENSFYRLHFIPSLPDLFPLEESHRKARRGERKERGDKWRAEQRMKGIVKEKRAKQRGREESESDESKKEKREK